MAGVPIFLDASTTPMRTLTQISGQAVRIKASIIKETFDTGGSLQKLLHRYIHTVIVLGSQSTACNGLHNIEARLCRWLLMSSDGVESDSLCLTQEFLSTMLGVRRSGVSETASNVILAMPTAGYAYAFVILANPFVISANPFAISANPFAISANPFAISANPFVISAYPFAISAIVFVTSAMPTTGNAYAFVDFASIITQKGVGFASVRPNAI